jgi:hypothetical protein
VEIIFPKGEAAKNSVAVGTIKREQEVEKDGREKETNQTV